MRTRPIESADREYIPSKDAAVSELTTERINSGRQYTRRATTIVGSRKVAAATATYEACFLTADGKSTATMSLMRLSPNSRC